VAQRGQAVQGVRCWQVRSGVVVAAAEPGVSLGVDGGGIRRSIVEGCVVEAVRGCAAAGAAEHVRARAAANGRQLSSVTYLSPSLLLSLTHTHRAHAHALGIKCEHFVRLGFFRLLSGALLYYEHHSIVLNSWNYYGVIIAPSSSEYFPLTFSMAIYLIAFALGMIVVHSFMFILSSYFKSKGLRFLSRKLFELHFDFNWFFCSY
jgi:hypothetical protein